MADRYERAIASSHYGDLVDRMSAMVDAIHDDLEWEFSKGVVARHALCVSPAGKSFLRAMAERWRIAAPPSSDVWESHAARAASPDALRHRLQIGENGVERWIGRIEPSTVRCSICTASCAVRSLNARRRVSRRPRPSNGCAALKTN